MNTAKISVIFLVILFVISGAVPAFAASSWYRSPVRPQPTQMGVVQINSNGQSGTFTCGAVPKNQNACYRMRSNNPLLIGGAAACTAFTQVCYDMGRYAAYGTVIVVGATVVYLLDYASKTFYFTQFPKTTIGWTSTYNLQKHFDDHAYQLKDLLGPIPTKPKFDERCRESYNRQTKTYQDKGNNTFVRFEPYAGNHGLMTVVNDKGEMVDCQPKNTDQFNRQTGTGNRYIPVSSR